MIIEHRAYTMRPGCAPTFLAAQEERGFGPPFDTILNLLIGYFVSSSGPVDQIVHLWRFDSLEDWNTRMQTIYGRPELEAYFRKVRSLMLAQENRFLTPAPLPQLTPLWGNGNDWLRDKAGPALTHDMAGLIEETTITLLPGTVPAYWEAWKDHAEASPLSSRNILGAFVGITGRLHQVMNYRYFSSEEAGAVFRTSLTGDLRWQRFLETVRPFIADASVKLLRPAPLPQMSPLFP